VRVTQHLVEFQSFGYAILIRHVLAQPGVRKVEAGAPWAVGSATRAWNFRGVRSVTKVENLRFKLILLYGDTHDITLALVCRRYYVAASREMTTVLNVAVAVKH